MDKQTAYYEWLGIPLAKCPPNHYVLLGIPVFEDCKTVIENAAARNIFFLQRFFSSPFAELAQEVQKEVAAAKKLLCDQGTKKEYDVELATEIHHSESRLAMEAAAEQLKAGGSQSIVSASASIHKTTDTETIRDIIDEGLRCSTLLAEMKNWLIGWDPDKCDIVVNNKFVSAKHCILFWENNCFEIEDLKSTNGTYVNGEKITPRKRYPVTREDDITLGRKTMLPWPPVRPS